VNCGESGVIYLRTPHTVCKEGDTLTPDQAKILKLLDMKMSEFYFQIIGMWSDDKYQDLTQQDADMTN
jgi:mRNA turnover protein 4